MYIFWILWCIGGWIPKKEEDSCEQYFLSFKYNFAENREIDIFSETEIPMAIILSL